MTGIVFLVIWEATRPDPIVNVRLMAKRNFAGVLAVMFTTGVILFGSIQLIPAMLQQVFGYTATDAGLAMTAGGFATVMAVPFAGRLAGKVDARILIGGALIVSAIALGHLTTLDADGELRRLGLGARLSGRRPAVPVRADHDGGLYGLEAKETRATPRRCSTSSVISAGRSASR